MGFFDFLIDKPKDNRNLVISKLRHVDCRTLARWAWNAVPNKVDDRFLHMIDFAHVDVYYEKNRKFYLVSLADIKIDGQIITILHKATEQRTSYGWKERAFEVETAFRPGLFFVADILAHTNAETRGEYPVDTTQQEIEELGYEFRSGMR